MENFCLGPPLLRDYTVFIIVDGNMRITVDDNMGLLGGTP